MFDLDKEIARWRGKLRRFNCIRAERLDELEDHLRCRIEELQAKGDTAASAFQTARQELRPQWKPESSKAMKLILGNAIMFAAAILATALILSNGDGQVAKSSIVLMVLIPLWFMSDLLLKRALRQ